MQKKFFSLLVFTVLSIFSISLTAQYNSAAGQNIIYEDHFDYATDANKIAAPANKRSTEVNSMLRKANSSTKTIKVKDEKTGKIVEKTVERKKVATDAFGNAQGSQFDLAVDGAFKGEYIAVLHLYTGEGFDFELPKKALQEKGFGIMRWQNEPPSADELKKQLKKASQLWLISSNVQKLNADHLAVIKEFFESGKGVYIWGDNQPYYADANYVGAALLDVTMTGNTMGNQTVNLKDEDTQAGILQNHLITTGMNYVYEGVTIATVDDADHMTPLIWGSAGNVVTAVYEHDGKRAIFDGGFTRLFLKWDTAGTGRYVKNAAAWLQNVENRGYNPKEQ
ncbi:MAG: hypothetical protein MK212_20430 [Saprospiraceae bacterium]|nr:hypothetical protein [Saprospiraceae bacterium]